MTASRLERASNQSYLKAFRSGTCAAFRGCRDARHAGQVQQLNHFASLLHRAHGPLERNVFKMSELLEVEKALVNLVMSQTLHPLGPELLNIE